MTRPQRPSLASTDDLTQAADIDINLALTQRIEQGYRFPIIRPSTATDVAALIDESFPQGDGSPEYPVSPTRVNGKPLLRVCIANQATRVEHTEGLLASALRKGWS